MRPLLSTILLTAVLSVLSTASPALAQSPQAELRALLESRDADIKRLLGRTDAEVTGERREQLRTVINGIIDFDAMSRGALGPHWDGLSGAQRTEFTSVFGAIIRGQSLRNLKPYRAAITYRSVDVTGDAGHVVTSATVDDVVMIVAYELARGGNGWHITDVVIDDVGTVEGYARSFQSVIRKRGFDALMQRLREKLAEVEAEG